MKKNLEIINEEGINGLGTSFIDTESEDFKMLQKAILEHASKQTPHEKREIQLIGLRLQMEDYLNQTEPKEILNVGYFLRKILKELRIKNNIFAEYIGLTKTNFSALIHGKRKLNSDLALKLSEIFKINPDIWISIEKKNELIEIKKENKLKYKKYRLEDLISH